MPANKLLLTMLLALGLIAEAHADLVVVTSAKSGIAHMTHEEVVFVFMGRWRHLPSGAIAQPIDAPADSPERATFYRLLVNKDTSDIRAYWSRLIFSGGARPPYAAHSAEEQLKMLSTMPGAIGYVDRSQVDAYLHVVYDFVAHEP